MKEPEVREDGVEGDRPKTPGRDCLTIGEVAAATTLSISTIERLIRQAIIVPVQPGGKGHRRIFPAEAIERLLRLREAIPPLSVESGTKKPKPLRGPCAKWNKSPR